MNEKILFVDDDPNVLEGYQRRLSRVLRVDTALGGNEGLKRLAENGPYAVVVADMKMPGMNGIEFLARVKELVPNTVRMMLTGNADTTVAVDAVNEGNIFRFLTKPCPADVMGKALVAGISQYRLIIAEQSVIEDTLKKSVELLVEILSWADPITFGQTMQLRGAAKDLATHLKIRDTWEIELGVLLSRIGQIMLPHDVMAKSRSGIPLSYDEIKAVRQIPQAGSEILSRIPRLEPVARIVLYQQKRFDGTGFPEDQVVGDAIPVGARILKVLTDLIELEVQGKKWREALSTMQSRSGWYDPWVLDAVIAYRGTSENKAAEAVTVHKKIDDLLIGDALVSDVKAINEMLLIKEGEIISDVLLARLRMYARLSGVREPIEVRRANPNHK